MFNKSQQEKIIKALSLNNVNTPHIQFMQNNRVIIDIEWENEKDIKLSQAGFFNFLKPTAWSILGAMGTTISNHEDINYFLIQINGLWFARFEVYPDPTHFTSQSKKRSTPSNWAIARSKALSIALYLINNGKQAYNAAQEVITQHYQGLCSRIALQKLLTDLEVIEALKLGFTIEEVSELFEVNSKAILPLREFQNSSNIGG